MTFAITYSRAQIGIEAPLITVEADISQGLPQIQIVGMPATTVKEAKDRVKSAIANVGLKHPVDGLLLISRQRIYPNKVGVMISLSRFQFSPPTATCPKMRCNSASGLGNSHWTVNYAPSMGSCRPLYSPPLQIEN